ncbi:MAG: ABC transporter substrate-binding protein [Actinomycetes bacterium]
MKRFIGYFIALEILILSSLAHADEYTIGVMQSLTGAVAFAGVPGTNGIRLAVDEINTSGFLGPHKLKILVEDTAFDKSQAISITNRFARQTEALMIIGPTSTPEALTTGPLVNNLKIPQFTFATFSAIPESGPFSFKGSRDSGGKFADALVEYASNKLGVKKCSIVFDRSADGWVGQAKDLRTRLKTASIEIVSDDSIATSDTDFTGVGTKLATVGPDCLFLSMAVEQAASVVVQAKQSGMSEKTKILAFQAEASPPWIEIGGKAIEGSIVVSDVDLNGINDEGRRFVADYIKRYNMKPTNFAAVAYAMTKVAAIAIRNAGPKPDREKVRSELAKIKNVPSILGRGLFSMDAKRTGEYDVVLLTVKNGAFIRTD